MPDAVIEAAHLMHARPKKARLKYSKHMWPFTSAVMITIMIKEDSRLDEEAKTTWV